MNIFNRIANWLIRRSMRTPYFHLEGYMDRYWLIPYNKFSPAVRIHHILRSDNDRAFHDHPWPYLTIILRGGYFEVKPMFDKSGLYIGDSRKWCGPGSVLFRRAKSWHRLEIPEGETAWTLFITGKYQQRWGFMINPRNKISYRDYEKETGR